MIDLETMALTQNAAIVSIGAVMFTGRSICEEFYCNIDLQSSLQAGLELDGDTVMWWMRQKKAARKVLVDKPVSLYNALSMFADWFDDADTLVWGNGPDFDNAILANAFTKLSIDLPWDFRQNRCFRTAKNIFPEIELNREGTHHNALDDAKNQALHLIKINKHINELNKSA